MYTQLTQNGRTLVKYLGLKAVIFVMIVWLTFGPKSLCCYSLQNRIGADTNAWASESRAHFMALHWNPRHAEQLQRWESALWHQASISSVVLKTESSIFITYIFSDMKVVHDFPKSLSSSCIVISQWPRLNFAIYKILKIWSNISFYITFDVDFEED